MISYSISLHGVFCCCYCMMPSLVTNKTRFECVKHTHTREGKKSLIELFSDLRQKTLEKSSTLSLLVVFSPYKIPIRSNTKKYPFTSISSHHMCVLYTNCNLMYKIMCVLCVKDRTLFFCCVPTSVVCQKE